MAKREWITYNWGWKLFSAILAVIIWFTVHIYEEPGTATPAAGNKVTYDNLPVTVVSTAADVRNFRVAPDTVAVTVEGPAKVMAILQANQIRADVDVTDVQNKNDEHRPVFVSTPTGVTLVSVDPPKVAVIIPPPPGKKP